MADFSSSDIEMAKMRVQEMKNRARQYVDSTERKKNNEDGKKEPPSQNEEFADSVNEKENIQTEKGLLHHLLGSKDSSLILALVLILSREGADNMLILALLYILL